MSTQTIEELRQRSRRFAWIAFALGALSFVIALTLQVVFGGLFSWTSWAMPLLVSANAGVMLLPQSHKHPRATSIYFGVSGLVALVILGAIVEQMFQRSR